jgi:dihydrofolate reductase
VRELTYFVAVSLDGRIAGPGGDFSAFPTTGDHLEMIAADYRDTLSAPGLAALGLTADRSRFDTVLMGWNTYAVGLPFGVDNPYPHLRQHVFSRSARTTPAEVQVLADDPVRVVRALKAERGGSGIWLCGGGLLAAALAQEIDELVLKVNPVVLGDGPSLFGPGPWPRSFTLTGSTPYGSGVVVNAYRPT